VNATRVLVACVGNIFLGDDGFGVEVAARLARRPLPDHVRVVDFGIRGLHLAYELLDGVDRLILVDAAQRGEKPGTVSVLRVLAQPNEGPDGEPAPELPMSPMDAHDMSPDTVLDLVHALGGLLGEVLVVTCEPVDVGANLGLSDAVLAAVDPAVDEVQRLLTAELSTPQETRTSESATASAD
jgi:hydrogenase maturation protease